MKPRAALQSLALLAVVLAVLVADVFLRNLVTWGPAVLVTALLAGLLLLLYRWLWHGETRWGTSPLGLAGASLFALVLVGSAALLNGHRLGFSVGVALLPALIEEVAFRGVLLDFLARTFGAWKGLALSAAVFGLLHIANALFGQTVDALYVLNITVAGLVLGLVYLGTGLTGAFLVHFAWNATINSVAVESSLATLGVLAVGAALLAMGTRGRL